MYDNTQARYYNQVPTVREILARPHSRRSRFRHRRPPNYLQTNSVLLASETPQLQEDQLRRHEVICGC